jgi:hypothetical protein
MKVACLIQDFASPHCGDKRMARRCTRRSLPNYFDMTSYHWNTRQNTVTWRWLCEPVSLRVAIATSCDAVSSRNRQDLIHNLVPPHYVCNKFIEYFNKNEFKTNSKGWREMIFGIIPCLPLLIFCQQEVNWFTISFRKFNW